MTEAVSPGGGPAWPEPRPTLYLLSPLPPQRNGLADYIEAYLPMLARDYRLVLVAEAGHAASVRAHFTEAPFEVIDEAQFGARLPHPEARILYNLGNNRDCVHLLDHLHRWPGTILLHDVSLFHLHRIALQQARAEGLIVRLLAEDGVTVPAACLRADGTLGEVPSAAYQEWLMLRRIVRSARSVVVHSAYARRRAWGSIADPGLGADGLDPLARKFRVVPHFVRPPPALPPGAAEATLARFDLRPEHVVLVVPGFLTGNKMPYEVLVAFRRARRRHPLLRLLFAGEERADEYPLSARIRLLWPDGGGPVVTGYLDDQALDALLDRADLGCVLRHPTYGESSGTLPRAVMGGGRVVTVDVGAYREFAARRVVPLALGPGLVDALEAAFDQVVAERAVDPPRAVLQAEARRHFAPLAPEALYGALRAAIESGVPRPEPARATPEAA